MESSGVMEKSHDLTMVWAVSIVLSVLSACGGGSSMSSSAVAPRVGGQYGPDADLWTIRFLRVSDGHETLSRCSGALFLQQSYGESVVGQLTGSATVGEPCWPMTFNLSGLVWADGRIELTTNGPAAPGIPCSPAIGIQYSGQVVAGSDSDLALSAEGNGDLRCPDGEEYAATYILSAARQWRYY